MKPKKLLSLTFVAGIMFMQTAALANDSTHSAISVYPTPSHQMLVVKTEQNGYLRILDENGLLVKETLVYRGENQFRLSEMKAQRYVLQVKTADNNLVKRLVIR